MFLEEVENFYLKRQKTSKLKELFQCARKFPSKFPQFLDKVGHGSLGTAPCLQDKVSQIFALHLNHRLLHLKSIFAQKFNSPFGYLLC